VPFELQVTRGSGERCAVNGELRFEPPGEIDDPRHGSLRKLAAKPLAAWTDVQVQRGKTAGGCGPAERQLIDAHLPFIAAAGGAPLTGERFHVQPSPGRP